MDCAKCKAKLKQGELRCPQCGRQARRLLTTVGKSSIGMDENIAAASAYSFLFFSGIFFLLIERKSAFVRFHALQGAVALFLIFVINIALAFIPGYGIFLAIVLWLLNLVLIVNLFLKALAGEWYTLPVVGRLAANRFRP
ncbi:MAG: DUF4870 domain-containing protein [Bacillota bacterium]